MNEQYRNYPRAIREEIEQITYNEKETPKLKKKKLGCWRKLRLTLFLLKKPFK